ncbi:MAG TPA: hypothetical protein DCM57_04835 [Treponema sp.]|jgi:hypothetical protein|nr:hypothetical protein [Treponema sp.]
MVDEKSSGGYMKKSSLFAGLAAAMMSLLTFSCGTLGSVVQPPALSMRGISISGLDMNGITFNCAYDIKNPYNASLSLKEVAADIKCNSNPFTTVKTNGGISLKAMGTTSNSFAFTVPYDSILNLAKAIGSMDKLPFGLDGSVTVDVSSVPALALLGETLKLPVKADFDVPVFKPELSVANFSVKMPTLNDLRDQLVSGGLGITKALQVATTLLSGNKLDASILDGINMNIDFTFDVKVANKGGANWKFDVNDCSLKTVAGTIADVGPVDPSASVTGTGGTIPMKVSLNTLQTGAFIVQLLNKTGSNPVFTVESGLTFPDTKYAPGIPLKYSCEIPLSSVSRK